MFRIFFVCCIIFVALSFSRILIAEEPCGADSDKTEKSQPICKIRGLRDQSTVHVVEKSSGKKLDYTDTTKNKIKKIFTSPDKVWNVVVYKVYKKKDYYALPINLTICEIMEPIYIPAVPISATFESIFVTLKFLDGSEKRSIMRGKCL
jgi:hypothetical protein